MKLVLRIALCCIFAVGVSVAQRGGGGHGGGGIGHGGAGFSRGGGFGGGFSRGGGFTGGAFRGGFGWGRGGYYRGFGGNWGGYYGGYYPYYGSGFGLDYGYWPGYYNYGYGNDYPSYSYPSYNYPVYDPSPNVTVINAPPSAPATVYMGRPSSVIHEYDQYGQEINRPAPAANSGPPIYLIAFHDHTIRAANAYWTEGGTLHYVTLEHEQKQVPLGSVDREFSSRLNRERRVPFSLPTAQ